MSCQKCDSIPDILALLQELKSELSGIKTKCSRIEKEILGISNEAEANPVALMENITLKQIVEKTAYDVECLKKRIDEQEESRRAEAEQTSNDKVRNEPFVPVDINVQTREEEINIVRAELEAIKNCRTLAKGRSFEGKTSAEVASSIAASGLPYPLAIVINNYLCETVSVVNTWNYPYSDNIIDSAPTEIAGGQMEIVKWSSDGYAAVLMELALGSSDIRIILLGCNRQSSKEVGVRDFITTQTNFKLNRNLYNYMYHSGYLWKYSTHFACDMTWSGAEVFAKLGDIRIRSATETGQHPIASVDLGSVQERQSHCTILALAPSNLETLVKPRLKSVGSAASVLTPIGHSFACVIEIGNGLPINLVEPLTFLDLEVSGTIPHEMGAQTIGYAVASDGTEFRGAVSYRLGTTDPRLTLGFIIGEYGNEYAMAFFHLESYHETHSLLEILFKDDPYFQRPDAAHGSAADGRLRIVRGNVVAEARMTNNRRATLEVLITTF